MESDVSATVDPQVTVFIGSSTESLPIAEALAENLAREVHPWLWTGDVFKPGAETHQSLLDAAERCDFAVLVLDADGVLIERGVEWAAPRDNVIYEFGLFMGRLGPSRTFYLYDTTKNPKRPTDVIGITGLGYRPGNRAGGAVADLSVAAGKIKRRVREIGPLRRRVVRPTVYWCAPHTNVERNRDAATILRENGISVLMPNDLVYKKVGMQAHERPADIRRVCVDAIKSADFLVVDLDHYGLDSAWELGFAEAINKRVIGLNWNEVGIDETRSINRRPYDHNFMHGWDEFEATTDLKSLSSMCAGKVVHVCGAFENEGAMKALRESVVAASAKSMIFPKDMLELGASYPRDYLWRARQEAIRLLAHSDIILTILPRYGMDTSWQLGQAVGLGKRIVGWISDDTIPQVVNEQALDHWMHGWKQKARLRDIYDLAALIRGLSAADIE